MPDPSLFKSGATSPPGLRLTPRLDEDLAARRRTAASPSKAINLLRRLLVLAPPLAAPGQARPEKASPWLRGMMPAGPGRSSPSPRPPAPPHSLWAMLTTTNLSRAGHRLTRQTPSQGAQQQLMAKSAGIPDRDHSVLHRASSTSG